MEKIAFVDEADLYLCFTCNAHRGTLCLDKSITAICLSIPLNIVEGCGKNSDKDFTHYLDNALGSAHEVEYTCFLIFDLEYISKELYDDINTAISEVKAMLIAFIKFLRREA